MKTDKVVHFIQMKISIIKFLFTRYDRDSFLRVNFQNILAGRENNFAKKNMRQQQNGQTPYDYDSVMQYSSHAFSKNGQKTLEAIDSQGKSMNKNLGQRNGFSATDLVQLEALYDCPSKAGSTYSSWSHWSPCYTDRNECKRVRDRFCFKPDAQCIHKNGVKGQKHEVEYDTKGCPVAKCNAVGKWTVWRVKV